MKNIGVIILIYNILCLLIINTDWYINYQPQIDFYDIPLYISLSIITFISIYKWYYEDTRWLKFYQLYSITASWVLLFFKIVQTIYPINYYSHIFYLKLTILTCIVVIIDEKINKT